MAKAQKKIEIVDEGTYGLYEVRRGLLPVKRYWCDHPVIAINNYIRDFRLASNLDKKLFDVCRKDNNNKEIDE